MCRSSHDAVIICLDEFLEGFDSHTKRRTLDALEYRGDVHFISLMAFACSEAVPRWACIEGSGGLIVPYTMHAADS
jgi:hypothetical protein